MLKAYLKLSNARFRTGEARILILGSRYPWGLWELGVADTEEYWLAVPTALQQSVKLTQSDELAWGLSPPREMMLAALALQSVSRQRPFKERANG